MTFKVKIVLKIKVLGVAEGGNSYVIELPFLSSPNILDHDHFLKNFVVFLV